MHCIARKKKADHTLHDYAFADSFGTESFLVSLALGRVKEPPFEAKAVRELKASAIAELHGRGIHLERKTGDREDVPIDKRYLDLLLRAAGDPEVGLGEYAQGIRVGPGVRMPRLLALYKKKKHWRIPEQPDPLDYLESPQDEGVNWRHNDSSLDQWKDKALEVSHDQAHTRASLNTLGARSKEKVPKPSGCVVGGRSAKTNPTGK